MTFELRDASEGVAGFDARILWYKELYVYKEGFGKAYAEEDWTRALAELHNWARKLIPRMKKDDPFFDRHVEAIELFVTWERTFFFCSTHNEWRVSTSRPFGRPLLSLDRAELSDLLRALKEALNDGAVRLGEIEMEKGMDIPLKQGGTPGKELEETKYG